ncbi:MAG: polyphosphate:AMP phosphotransferase, partial [Acidimicrobiia bacterium]|nr:polyphosphate:AMP phosphotransferase [Acidimicrobiia bacterium]
RVDLVNAHFDLRGADFTVLIVIVGDDQRGVSAVVNRLNEWMDARFIQTHVFGAPTEEELQRPRNWRYWRALPGRGELAIYTGAFALDTITERLKGVIDDVEFDRRIDHMASFERELFDDGALVVKFWIHLPRKALKKRLRKSGGKDGKGLDDVDQLVFDAYDELRPLSERVLRRTDSSGAPWHVVEGSDARYRDLTVARTIRGAVLERLAQPPAPPQVTPARAARSAASDNTVLDTVDLGARLDRASYKEQRAELQDRLRRLSQRARERGVASVALFEGWDAAGKGGVIRRVSTAMDVADYRIVAVRPPTEEELARHYLWRFWRQLPRAGRMLVFDRSWYGRVLVERVEALVPEPVWRRAYREINDFEEQIVERGIPLFKFWLHIDPDEQLRRFRQREQTPYKKYKITDEDYRNRARWDDYVAAVNEMVQRTSTELAPWTLVPSNDKRFARAMVLRTICEGLAERVDQP